MSNNLRMLPGRWFAPRDAAFRVNTPVQAPLRDEIDRIFQEMFNGMVTPWDEGRGRLSAGPAALDQTLVPQMDLTSDDAAYQLRLELPGVDAEKVSVAVHNNVLVISGEKQRDTGEEDKNQHVRERVFGSFQRVMSFPEDADAEAITAASKNGVLSVRIPRKAAAGPAVKQIEIVRD